jgi:hypothetical protein
MTTDVGAGVSPSPPSPAGSCTFLGFGGRSFRAGRVVPLSRREGIIPLHLKAYRE